jgi:hypothetical protein
MGYPDSECTYDVGKPINPARRRPHPDQVSNRPQSDAPEVCQSSRKLRRYFPYLGNNRRLMLSYAQEVPEICLICSGT